MGSHGRISPRAAGRRWAPLARAPEPPARATPSARAQPPTGAPSHRLGGVDRRPGGRGPRWDRPGHRRSLLFQVLDGPRLDRAGLPLRHRHARRPRMCGPRRAAPAAELRSRRRLGDGRRHRCPLHRLLGGAESLRPVPELDGGDPDDRGHRRLRGALAPPRLASHRDPGPLRRLRDPFGSVDGERPPAAPLRLSPGPRCGDSPGGRPAPLDLVGGSRPRRDPLLRSRLGAPAHGRKAAVDRRRGARPLRPALRARPPASQ